MTGYTVHPSGTPGEAALLAIQRLKKQQIADALTLHARRERMVIGTIIGVSKDGVIFTPDQYWHPDCPDAMQDLHIVPWVLIHELLGNLPAGSTGDFLNSGGQQ